MYTTRQDAEAMITQTIEAGGAADATDYNIDQIFETCFEYSADLQAFVQTVDTDSFWDAVEEAAL